MDRLDIAVVAMQGFLASSSGLRVNRQEVVEAAFEMADRMLAHEEGEREKERERAAAEKAARQNVVVDRPTLTERHPG